MRVDPAVVLQDAGTTSYLSADAVAALALHDVASDPTAVRNAADPNPVGGDPKGAPPVGGDPKGAPPVGGDPKGAPPLGGDPKGAPPLGGDPKGTPRVGGDPKGAPGPKPK
jgi:hypothetical protein